MIGVAEGRSQAAPHLHGRQSTDVEGQFSPVAVWLRAGAELGRAVQTFSSDAQPTGVTDQGLTCDAERRGDLGEERTAVGRDKEREKGLLFFIH